MRLSCAEYLSCDRGHCCCLGRGQSVIIASRLLPDDKDFSSLVTKYVNNLDWCVSRLGRLAGIPFFHRGFMRLSVRTIPIAIRAMAVQPITCPSIV